MTSELGTRDGGTMNYRTMSKLKTTRICKMTTYLSLREKYPMDSIHRLDLNHRDYRTLPMGV